MLRRRIRPVLAVTGASVAALGSLTATASAKTGPPQPNFATALAASLVAPDLDPPGANDWTCKPSAAHPRPVVLVHGTFENRYDNWAYISPKLKAAGYCVYALDYGDDPASVVGQSPAIKGTGDMYRSAKELSSFVDRVLASAGTKQVDIVGHSQGGLMPRAYLKYEGGANRKQPSRNKVRRLVSLGATNHGTTLSGVGTLAAQLRLLGGGQILLGRAAIQQTKEAGFARDVNAGGETFPGIGYTVIGTRYDEISTPYHDTFLSAGPGASVHNVTLQDGCEIDLADHLSMTYDPRGLQLVLNALDPKHAKPLPCAATTPLFTLSTILPPLGTTPAPGGETPAVPTTPVPTVPAAPVNPNATTPGGATATVKVGAKITLPGVSLAPSVTVTLPVLAPSTKK